MRGPLPLTSLVPRAVPGPSGTAHLQPETLEENTCFQEEDVPGLGGQTTIPGGPAPAPGLDTGQEDPATPALLTQKKTRLLFPPPKPGLSRWGQVPLSDFTSRPTLAPLCPEPPHSCVTFRLQLPGHQIPRPPQGASLPLSWEHGGGDGHRTPLAAPAQASRQLPPGCASPGPPPPAPLPPTLPSSLHLRPRRPQDRSTCAATPRVRPPAGHTVGLQVGASG